MGLEERLVHACTGRIGIIQNGKLALVGDAIWQWNAQTTAPCPRKIVSAGTAKPASISLRVAAKAEVHLTFHVVAAWQARIDKGRIVHPAGTLAGERRATQITCVRDQVPVAVHDLAARAVPDRGWAWIVVGRICSGVRIVRFAAGVTGTVGAAIRIPVVIAVSKVDAVPWVLRISITIQVDPRTEQIR
jgi:hypothetical protein